MNLLKAALYDPAAAVSKATSALLAMTAFDTTNLRLAITVPAHGMVRFRMRCPITGATTCPNVLLGVMNGATVIGRVQPTYENATANAATQSFVLDAEFTVTGLTPGAMNVDAAYAVQVLVAATNIKYGGPNTNAGANAWGGFLFEAWDPQPQSANSTLTVDANGRVDVSKVSGTTQTARDLGAQLDATVSSRMATFTLPTNFSAMAITAGGAVTAGTVSDKTGYALTAVYDPAKTSAQSTDYTTARAAKLDNLDAVVSSRLATAGYTTPPTAAAVRTEIDANSTGLAAIFARTDVATSTRLAAASYTAPDNAGVAAIKAKTDSLVFTIAGKVDSSLYYVNGLAITGVGSEASPWKAP